MEDSGILNSTTKMVDNIFYAIAYHASLLTYKLAYKLGDDFITSQVGPTCSVTSKISLDNGSLIGYYGKDVYEELMNVAKRITT
jgi:hypothetical protein